MAKTVKITFYNPKELWHMFWTKFFWPPSQNMLDLDGNSASIT